MMYNAAKLIVMVMFVANLQGFVVSNNSGLEIDLKLCKAVRVEYDNGFEKKQDCEAKVISLRIADGGVDNTVVLNSARSWWSSDIILRADILVSRIKTRQEERDGNLCTVKQINQMYYGSDNGEKITEDWGLYIYKTRNDSDKRADRDDRVKFALLTPDLADKVRGGESIEEIIQERNGQ